MFKKTILYIFVSIVLLAILTVNVQPPSVAGYTHDTRFDGYTIINGIDVSSYQGNIQWTKVATAGIDFAFVRVGYRGYGNGALTEDANYAANLTGATSAGIKAGVYFASQAITPAEAIQEADYVLSRLKGYDITMPVVFNFEYAGNHGRLESANLSKSSATSICLAFCNRVKAAGYKTAVYANKTLLTLDVDANAISGSNAIWLANYTNMTNYSGDYTYWQYTKAGQVDGIAGPVDRDFWYYNAHPVSITSVTVKPVTDMPYTGNSITPLPVIHKASRILKKDIDYTLFYSHNKSIGKATLTVKGKGLYLGSKKVGFKIVPKRVSRITKAKKFKKNVSIKWVKVRNCSGYEIYRASKIKGKYVKAKTIKSKNTVAWKDAKGSKITKSFYKVRAYKKVSGKKYYGKFSPVKRSK